MKTRAKTSTRNLLNCFLVAGILFAAALLGTFFVRSFTALSHFSRIEYCSLCGIQQWYREICIFDRRIFRSTSHFENGVSKIFRRERPNCKHNFYAVYDRMIHLSRKTTPFLIKTVHGADYGADVLENTVYAAALAAIHAKSPEKSQLIWSRTVRHSLKGSSIPFDQIRVVLGHGNLNEVKSFLNTNRFFRPARPNPERLFYSSF